MRKAFLFLLTVSIAFLAWNPLSVVGAGGTQEGPYTSEEIQEVRAVLKQESVPEDKIDGLVYKLQHDIPWDSFNKKYKDLKPQIVMDGYQKTIYPDGSFLVSGIAPNKQQPNEEIERPTLPVEDKGTHEVQYTPEEIQEVRAVLKEESVPEDKIDGLVYKLQHGIPWDSFNSKYKDLKPQIVRDGYQKTIYPDGSYVVSEIIPIEPESNQNIDLSTIVPYTIYSRNGYLCRKSAVIVTMSFKIDYKRDTVAHKAIITNMYEYYAHVIGGTYSVDTRGFINGWQTKTNAWYAINVTAKDSWYQGRCFIKTYVTSNGAYDSASFPGLDI